VVGVVVEQAQRDLVERRLHSGDLGEDVDAVAVLVDHPLDAADLAWPVSYASVAEFHVWAALLHEDVPEDLEGLLDRATQDLHSYLHWPLPTADPDPLPTAITDPGSPVVGTPVPRPPSGRIDTTQLTWFQADCLARACVLQACYRLEVGDDALVEGRPQVLSVPGLRLATTAPDPVSPAAIACLSGAGLLRSDTGPGPRPRMGCPDGVRVRFRRRATGRARGRRARPDVPLVPTAALSHYGATPGHPTSV
jgi:hypothetical protein